MEILNSHLYKLLRYWQRFENGFNNVNEVYFLIYGYYTFMHNESLPKNLTETWIDDFFIYISTELKKSFYPDEELRNVHFGEIIQEFIPDEKKGVDLFYQILDKYINDKCSTPSLPTNEEQIVNTN